MTKKRCELITLGARQETRTLLPFCQLYKLKKNRSVFSLTILFHTVKSETKLFTPALKFQKEKLPKYLTYLFLTSS